jgi:hypothetical protein
MICEIAHAIHPAMEPRRRFMAVLTLKFDESYKARSLVISGWIGNEKQWKRRQSLWQKALAFENKSLPEGRKISRYHAAEMNANDGEYKGWKDEPARKLRFTKKLLKISGTGNMIPVAVGIDLVAFDEIFPHRHPSGIGTPYVLCIKALMNQLAEALAKHHPNDRLAIVHDHGDWDYTVLENYNQLVDDTRWEHRHRFVSITPLTWHDDVGLQSADLFAYETMRFLDDHNWKGENMRKPLQVLFQLMNRPAFGFHIGRNYLEGLRMELEKTGRLEPLPQKETA